MRAVVQRVRRAKVTVDDRVIGEIGIGLLVYLGVAESDTQDDAAYLADKIAGLRIFEDDQGHFNLGLADVNGGLLVVSQFTLLGDCRRGRRPSFTRAAAPEVAERLYEYFTTRLKDSGHRTATGSFGAMMDIDSVNWGPVTMLLDSRKLF